MKIHVILRVLLLFFVFLFRVDSREATRHLPFPEHYEVRRKLADLFQQPVRISVNAPATIYLQRSETHKVLFETRVQANSVYLLFLNEVDGDFPLVSPGNYVVKRDVESGTFTQIKVFLREDDGCFLRVFTLRFSLLNWSFLISFYRNGL